MEEIPDPENTDNLVERKKNDPPLLCLSPAVTHHGHACCHPCKIHPGSAVVPPASAPDSGRMRHLLASRSQSPFYRVGSADVAPATARWWRWRRRASRPRSSITAAPAVTGAGSHVTRLVKN
uniref:Uncharacterized protein n=1 Tax=Oryza rufipogon TaxID=4529 RepID=A0A0E0QGZ7_ORYRU